MDAMGDSSERNRDESSGRYIESINSSDVLALFNEIDGPAMTTSDVKTAFDVSGETARNKFDELYINANVAKRQSGRTHLYWRINQWDEPDESEAVARLTNEDTLHLDGPDFDFPVAYVVVSKRCEDDETVLDLEPCSYLGRASGASMKYHSQSVSTRGAVEYWVDRQKAQFRNGESLSNVVAKQIDASTTGPALIWRGRD